MTPLNPMSVATSLQCTNSSGLTHRSIGWCSLEGAQVLRDREDVAARIVKVANRLLDLVLLLAHAQDEIGLGDELGLARHRQDAQ